jgi:hypothetical protein
MTWLFIAYLIALLYIALRRAVAPNAHAFRKAWMAFALIFISHFFFTLLRAGNFGDSRDLALIEIWADGVEWLLLGISMIFLTGTLVPGSASAAFAASNPPPPPSPQP